MKQIQMKLKHQKTNTLKTRRWRTNQRHIANQRQYCFCPWGQREGWGRTQGAFHEHISKAPHCPSWIGSSHRQSCWANHLSWDCNPCPQSPRSEHSRWTYYAQAPWWRTCKSIKNANGRIKRIEMKESSKEKNKLGWKWFINSEWLVGDWRSRSFMLNQFSPT